MFTVPLRTSRAMRGRPLARPMLAVAALLTAGGGALPATASAIAPANDPFYRYDGTTPLAELEPGTPLKQRTVVFRVVGVASPLRAVQVLYRSADMTGRAVVNATTVVRSPARDPRRPRVISYQSAYDSLNPADQPSTVIAGGQSRGALLPQLEQNVLAPFLLAGVDFVIPDTEGQSAAFGLGPSYGLHTLYSIRAMLAAGSLAYPASTRVGLIGYSGGAIATEWATELAPKVAPDVNARIIGSTFGGVPVAPHRMLRYVDGAAPWSGVIPMAIIGISRDLRIDLSPYMSPAAKALLRRVQAASIVEVMPLTLVAPIRFAQLVRPEYRDPASIPVFVSAANQLIMGRGTTPTVPMYIGQGAAGAFEGTAGNKPGIGAGDGVTIAGDTRWLARTYCSRGATVQYQEFRGSSHVGAVVAWLPKAVPWLLDRFAGRPAPSNCTRIPEGNDVQPMQLVSPGSATASGQ